jgi:hypothetical protein
MADLPPLPVDYVSAMDEVFDKMGGIDAFYEWAMLNQDDFYKLIAKRLPNEVMGEGGGPLVIQLKQV